MAGERRLAGGERLPGEPFPVGELSLAGDPYAGLGDTGFSIQDELGLISVNQPRDPLFAAMMESVGVAEDDIARLVPRIVDYTDVNDRRSLDGAETHHYLEAGLPPPANWFLATPTEMNRVLGAAEVIDAAQWRRLRDMATPRIHVGVNFNTMPVPVAKAILGVEQDVLDTFLAERAEQPITSFARVQELTGAAPPVDPVTVAVVPSRFLRITTWWVGGAPRSVVGITLTPASRIGPWRTEYRYSEPVDRNRVLAEPPTPLLGGA
ncbi:MAG: general secretion pathway protein GspK [Gammaproteobacteria bacterium]|nr:general secretion pathway protein GspK [Gammaproteobacteria bacterium]